MWHDIFIIENILMTQKVNIVLYYLRMLPWIGKKIPEHLFANIKTKQVLAVLAFLVSLVYNFLMKLLYVGVLIVLPSVLMTSEGKGNTTFCVVFLYAILSGLAGPLISDVLTRPVKKDYIMIQLMHMDTKRYVEANWLIYAILQAIMLFLAIALLGYGNLPVWYALGMCTSSFLMRLFGNVYHLYAAQKNGKPLSMTYSILMFFLLYGIAYGGAYLGKNSELAWLVVVCFLTIAILSIFVTIHLKKKLQYNLVMRSLIASNRSVIDGSFKKEAYSKDVEIREKDISLEELHSGKYKEKKGYAYLNALFFQRHKRLFYKPMRNRIGFILVAFLITNIAVYFLGDIIVIESPLQALPPMVFVLYSISIGERVTRAMFYNCDVSLLRYGYYRQADAILTNFKIRLSKIMSLNAVLATMICLGFVVMSFLMPKPFKLFDLALFALCIYSISLFFSVHHLCMYYLLQPYTGELEMKSPIFGMISGIVYFFSYMAMRLDGSLLFTIIVLCATLLYSVVALLLVYKLAPKTFHIR